MYHYKEADQVEALVVQKMRKRNQESSDARQKDDRRDRKLNRNIKRGVYAE